MLPETQVAIGAASYTLKTIPAGEARPLYFRLLKVCGPAMVRALRSGVTGFSSLRNPETGALDPKLLGIAGDALEELLERLTEADFELFVKTFSRHTFIGTQQLSAVIDTLAFAGHPGHLIVWLRECLKFTFASFLSDLGSTSLPG